MSNSSLGERKKLQTDGAEKASGQALTVVAVIVHALIFSILLN
jgi:hypothetical protein